MIVITMPVHYGLFMDLANLTIVWDQITMIIIMIMIMIMIIIIIIISSSNSSSSIVVIGSINLKHKLNSITNKHDDDENNNNNNHNDSTGKRNKEN